MANVRKGRPPAGTVAPSLFDEPLQPGHLHPQAPTMSAIMAERREVAQLTTKVPAAWLEDWYRQQLAHATEQRDKRATAQASNMARLNGPDDPRWARWWRDEAAARYWVETVLHLERRGHIIVCPKHGVPGVEIKRPGGVTPEAWYEALSLRSYLEGEAHGHWGWWCQDCTPIADRGDRLYQAHITANSKRRGPPPVFPAGYVTTKAKEEVTA